LLTNKTVAAVAIDHAGVAIVGAGDVTNVVIVTHQTTATLNERDRATLTKGCTGGAKVVALTKQPGATLAATDGTWCGAAGTCGANIVQLTKETEATRVYSSSVAGLAIRGAVGPITTTDHQVWARSFAFVLTAFRNGRGRVATWAPGAYAMFDELRRNSILAIPEPRKVCRDGGGWLG
jgi:hypothetical protein